MIYFSRLGQRDLPLARHDGRPRLGICLAIDFNLRLPLLQGDQVVLSGDGGERRFYGLFRDEFEYLSVHLIFGFNEH